MHHESNEELRREVERTRARVAADVDAITNKMSPENMKNQAKESLQRAGHAAKERVVHTTRAAGRSIVDSARENPVPLMVIGAGIGWLIYNARQNARHHREGWREPGLYEDYEPDTSFDYEPSAKEKLAEVRERAGERIAHAGERMHEMRERAGERLSYARQRAGERLHHAREGAETFMNDNPLATGAIAMALGAGVGMMLPTTQREDRVFGERRDRLVQRGRQAVSELGEVAEHTAREAARIAKQDMQQRGTDLGKGFTTPGGAGAPEPSTGPGEEFDSTIRRGNPWEPHQA